MNQNVINNKTKRAQYCKPSVRKTWSKNRFQKLRTARNETHYSRYTVTSTLMCCLCVAYK